MLFPIVCFTFLLLETFLTWEKVPSLDRCFRQNEIAKCEDIATRTVILVLFTDFCISLLSLLAPT
ncbi:BQ5605_C030g10790 [Microbotryum silenes-dioicae]|uniref:BQ5605_C030g10790 protein n=1 Tax=Microbotryum silenes-dioicae TaxID=796604 RepID=A0A2X0PC94_9BASI|nr:BQ5605_C030g10790 [Microbotryum silenes-dioicae]